MLDALEVGTGEGWSDQSSGALLRSPSEPCSASRSPTTPTAKVVPFGIPESGFKAYSVWNFGTTPLSRRNAPQSATQGL